MAFNLQKKIAQNKVIEPYEKMLQKNNKDHGIETIEDPTNYTNMLESVRKNPDGDEILEKRLVEEKTAQSITEKQLNTRKSETPHRNNDGLPLADMSRKNVLDGEKEFSKENKKEKRDTDFWDKYVGTQIDADQFTTISGNDQPSQLLNNFDSREDFRKENPSMKQASVVEAIKDADAMLYHIYRNASEGNRTISNEEQKMVDDINNKKVRILAGE